MNRYKMYIHRPPIYPSASCGQIWQMNRAEKIAQGHILNKAYLFELCYLTNEKWLMRYLGSSRKKTYISERDLYEKYTLVDP